MLLNSTGYNFTLWNMFINFKFYFREAIMHFDLGNTIVQSPQMANLFVNKMTDVSFSEMGTCKSNAPELCFL